MPTRAQVTIQPAAEILQVCAASPYHKSQVRYGGESLDLLMINISSNGTFSDTMNEGLVIDRVSESLKGLAFS